MSPLQDGQKENIKAARAHHSCMDALSTIISPVFNFRVLAATSAQAARTGHSASFMMFALVNPVTCLRWVCSANFEGRTGDAG